LQKKKRGAGRLAKKKGWRKAIVVVLMNHRLPKKVLNIATAREKQTKKNLTPEEKAPEE